MADKKIVLGVTLAAQFEAACIRERFTLQDVDSLTQHGVLGHLRPIVREEDVEIVRTFDLDRPPTIPEGMTIVSNVKYGVVVHRVRPIGSGRWIAKFDKGLTATSESEQHTLKYESDRDSAPVIGVSGEQWLERLKDESPAPARLLDYLMEDRYLIPHDQFGWFNGGGTYVFFGTIFADAAGTPYVRCLHTSCSGEAGEFVQQVNQNWGEHDRAVVFRT